MSDNAGYQRWKGDVLLWHSACVPARTHTQSKHTFENAEQTEPTHPHGHGPTHACSYVQMYPKSLRNVSDTSYLTADNGTELWASAVGPSCLRNHNMHTYKRKRMTMTVPTFSASPWTSHIFILEKKKSFVGHFPSQMHILSWLVLGSGWFILVARRNPHMVDVLRRPYQQNQTWNLGQGCPVMTVYFPVPACVLHMALP